MRRFSFLPISVGRPGRWAGSVLFLSVFLAAANFLRGAPPAESPDDLSAPLFRVVDLAVGEAAELTLADGSRTVIHLLEVADSRDPIRGAVRRAVATVEVNGVRGQIEAGNYNLPIGLGGVQIDCPITSAYYTNSDRDHWRLEKDARFRIWPEGSPWVRPGTFGYPLDQRFLAVGTQSANEPTFIDGGERPERTQIYYHAGFDFAGYEGRTAVFAATDGLVVSVGNQHLDLEEHPPVRPRYDVIYLRDHRGWYYRYSHLKSFETVVQVGKEVKMGDKLGDLGKEGFSGGYAHLHFDVSMPMPSGQYGIQDAFAFVWQAWRERVDPEVIAVARPHSLARVGDTVTLDGSRSWARAGIARYEWTLSDGRTVEGPVATAVYLEPGTYSEILKVVSEDGVVGYDFQEVQILSRDFHADRLPPTIDPVFHPTMNIQVGDPVHFAVRSFRVAPDEGYEEWDFGDGSPLLRVDSNPYCPKEPDTDRWAPDGYAHAVHRFRSPGHHLVTVRRTSNDGYTATGRLHVIVGEPEDLVAEE